AFSPDVIGCVATGKTVEQVVKNMREALLLHLDSLIAQHEEIPISKGLPFHMEEGVFNNDSIAEEFYVTQLEVPIIILS
ncbi:MAG: type II toxin-antitoxin system HicB family antitoxin, partial [Bacteroidota bacterium]